ncbi:MAG: FKBP-type peptidyl-prolyl cis-trans isomerase [Alloprevotella sp.]|nr:FKBP-type peptidyl-prolyl cis-trans isomerase [Alloprevotella sp.]
MKTKIFLALLLAVLCTGMQAQKKKAAKAKTATKETVTTAKPEEVKPVDAALYSYAQGILLGESLRDHIVQRLGVDSTYLETVVTYFTNPMPEEEAKHQYAITAGQQIADQNRKSILPTLNFEATGVRDTNLTIERVYCQALAEQVLRQPTQLSADSAKKIVAQQREYFNVRYKKLNEDYLAEHRNDPGTKVTPSGIQYVVLHEGTGPKPTADAKVLCHYEGKLIDGTVFDSSYQRGEAATFPVKGVIKGWQEILQMMPQGSRWRVIIPQELAYGERGAGAQIPPYATLTFEMMLIKADAK